MLSIEVLSLKFDSLNSKFEAQRGNGAVRKVIVDALYLTIGARNINRQVRNLNAEGQSSTAAVRNRNAEGPSSPGAVQNLTGGVGSLSGAVGTSSGPVRHLTVADRHRNGEVRRSRFETVGKMRI
jgi:hypothetical protein